MDKLFIYIFVMAGVTYLIRLMPFLIFRRQIKNKFICSFLYYVPYVTLSVMTFPAMLSATGNVYAGIAAMVVSLVTSFIGLPMVATTAAACISALGVQILCGML